MARNNTYTVRYRRRRNGLTDYRLRLRLLKSGLPRLVLRKSSKHVLAQGVAFHPQGDRILVSVHSRELAKAGWKASTNSVPACYAVGLLFAQKALQKGIKRFVPDLGLHPSIKGSWCYALLKGARDGGLDVQISDEVLPSDDRLQGKHIAQWAAALKKGGLPKGVFGRYGIAPETLAEHSEQVKQKLLPLKKKAEALVEEPHA